MTEEHGYHGLTMAVQYWLLAMYLTLFSLLSVAEAGHRGDTKWLTWVPSPPHVFPLTFGISFVSMCGGGHGQTVAFQMVAMLVEMYLLTTAFAQLPRLCNPRKFREYLFRYLQWYGILAIHKDSHGEEALHKINKLQTSVSLIKRNASR